MASHCYLVGPSGELFVEYLVRNCALSDQESKLLENSKEVIRLNSNQYGFQYKRLEVSVCLNI